MGLLLISKNFSTQWSLANSYTLNEKHFSFHGNWSVKTRNDINETVIELDKATFTQSMFKWICNRVTQN